MAETIRDWLARIDLAHLAPVFEQAEVQPGDLHLLQDADLKELGLALGPRKRVLHAIAAIPGRAAVQTAEPSEAHESEAERRQLTVMFCDLVGSTELSRRLDPEDLRSAMQSYQDAVARAVARYGGHLAKHLGDGLLVYFGWPRAYEKAVERAVRAGLDAVRSVASVELPEGRRLEVRVGIATGRVVVGDMVGEAGREAQAISGAAPNLAARLQQLAAPGQIVVDQASLDLIGTRVETIDLGEQVLKGFDEPVRAYAVLSLDSAGAPDPARERTRVPFLGRTPELELMLDRWERAREGEGQIVFVSGEAGIGKSRLLEAFVSRLDCPVLASLRFQCAAYGADEALYPVMQHYRRAAGIEASDSGDIHLDKLERLLAASGADVATTAPFLARLLALSADDRYGPIALSPEQRKERTLAAMLHHLEALAARGPVLMLFEDAHWSDPTTCELLESAASMIASQPVLLVVTHRPEWQASFRALPHATLLTLNRLGRGQSNELVRAAGGASLPANVIDQIVARTDGNPLFLEELTRSMLDAGGAATEVPTTLDALLHARLDRLGPAKHIAQIGSVIGREFGHSLLTAVAGVAEDELAPGLEQLVESGLFYRRGRAPESSYVFKHALVQEAAYSSVLKSRRRALHAEVAGALLETGSDRPALMAHHWERAEDFEQALRWRLTAAERASQLYAVREANSEYSSALDLLDRLPPSASVERRRAELLLQIVESTTYDWRDDAERAKHRRHLDRTIGVAVEQGDWGVAARLKAFTGSRWDDEGMLLDALGNAAASSDRMAEAVTAARCSYYYGKHALYERAFPHIERASLLYDKLDRKLARGLLLAGNGRCYCARAGRIEDAFRFARTAREIATEIRDPKLDAWLPMEAEVFFYKGLWQQAIDVVEREIGSAWAAGAFDVLLWTHAWAGIAHLKLGRPDRADELIGRAMSEVVPKVGQEFPKMYFLIALAHLQLARGDAQAAADSARQALEYAENSRSSLEEGASHRSLAEAYERAGSREDALAHHERSIAILGAIQSPPELAQSLLAHGRCLTAFDREAARTQLGRAMEFFERLGAVGWVDEVRRDLEELDSTACWTRR